MTKMLPSLASDLEPGGREHHLRNYGARRGRYGGRDVPASRIVRVKMRAIEAAFDVEPEGWWRLVVTGSGPLEVVATMKQGEARRFVPVERPATCGTGPVTPPEPEPPEPPAPEPPPVPTEECPSSSVFGATGNTIVFDSSDGGDYSFRFLEGGQLINPGDTVSSPYTYRKTGPDTATFAFTYNGDGSGTQCDYSLTCAFVLPKRPGSQNIMGTFEADCARSHSGTWRLWMRGELPQAAR